MTDRVAITVFTGSADRLSGVAILVSGAVAMDLEVELFLQLWAVYAFRKKAIATNSQFSEFGEMAGAVQARQAELRMPPWHEMLRQAREFGNLRIYACSNACQIWKAGKEDLDMVDEIMGAGEWILRSMDSKMTYYV